MAVLGASVCALAACAASPKIDRSLVGDWQYVRTSAWVRITPDGRAFQCRQGRSGAVFRSVGRVQGATIEWEQIWGTDELQRRGESIVLEGTYGTFSFGKALDPMPPACETPF